MSEFRIASRYAKSLLDLSKEQNIVEEVYKDMELVLATIKGVREFELLLKSPIVKDSMKVKIMDKIFSKKVHNVTLSFMQLVAKKARATILETITREFHNQYLILKGIQEVDLTTTFKIDEGLRKEFKAIVEKLTNKKPTLTEKVSDEIIGGFILDIGDRRIDASVKSNLQKIEYELTSEEEILKFK